MYIDSEFHEERERFKEDKSEGGIPRAAYLQLRSEPLLRRCGSDINSVLIPPKIGFRGPTRTYTRTHRKKKLNTGIDIEEFVASKIAIMGCYIGLN